MLTHLHLCKECKFYLCLHTSEWVHHTGITSVAQRISGIPGSTQILSLSL